MTRQHLTHDAPHATPGTENHAGRAIPQGRLVLMRHGETEWSKAMKHTGLTDIPLTPRGEELAVRTRHLLRRFDVVATYTSPLLRARRTAELAGLHDTTIDRNLMEWDYGAYEGRTTAEIRESLGYEWSVWDDTIAPGDTPGESIEQVAARARAVIDRVMPQLSDGDVALVAHGHLLRILAATWLRQGPRFGEALILDAGSVSALSYERDTPAIEEWNTRAEHSA